MGGGYQESLQGSGEKTGVEMSRRRDGRALKYVSKRTVALKISYDGRGYSGIAVQCGRETVGGHLECALRSSGLGERLVYAGRTDAGVSAINMIASGVLISRVERPNKGYELTEDDYREYRYDMMLNTYLPAGIRVVGWAPVPDTFSARFTCTQRLYRYYFGKDGLDPSRMDKAASRIREMRNFYYFSKHSDENARYERTLDECRVVDDGDLYYLDIRARAFLHNMVRKIVWAIQKEGRGEEYNIQRIGTAEPHSLVFCGAVYPDKLSFINSRRCSEEFRGQLESTRIECKMAALRLGCLDGDIKEEEGSRAETHK